MDGWADGGAGIDAVGENCKGSRKLGCFDWDWTGLVWCCLGCFGCLGALGGTSTPIPGVGNQKGGPKATVALCRLVKPLTALCVWHLEAQRSLVLARLR